MNMESFIVVSWGFRDLGDTSTNLLFDLQPANIMFTAAGTLSDDFLQPPEFSSVRWLEGVERDNSAPQYLMASQRIRGNLDYAELSTLLKLAIWAEVIHYSLVALV